MTGRTIDRLYPELPAVSDDAPAVLDVRDLHAEQLGGVSFELRRGEILGVGGLAGQGQRDLFMTLFGASKASGGEIRVDGRVRRIRKPCRRDPAPAGESRSCPRIARPRG